MAKKLEDTILQRLNLMIMFKPLTKKKFSEMMTSVLKNKKENENFTEFWKIVNLIVICFLVS